MIIDSIRFENYRAYYGETDFSFPVDGERNISIIFADNDVGKSCFFSGILFCLYGEPDNDKFKDLINVNAQQEGVFRAAVSARRNACICLLEEKNNEKPEKARSPRCIP